MILVQSQIVAVHAEINIQQSVAIVIRHGGMCEGSLRSARELEGIAFDREFAVSLINKEQRASSANDKKFLHPLILKTGKQSAARPIKTPAPAFFCPVLKASI